MAKLRFACLRVMTPPPAGFKIENLAQACFRFTSQIALTERAPQSLLFLEIGKSLSLFSELSLKARIEVIGKRLGVQIKTTFGDQINESLARSYYPDFKNGDFSTLPIEACRYFTNPFLEPVQTELQQVMRTLGIQRMDQFLALPSSQVGIRFGKVALEIHDFAKGVKQPVWNSFKPPLKIEEKHDLENEDLASPEMQMELLQFCLKTLIHRAMTRLTGLGLRASQVFIELKQVNWSTCKEKPFRSWTISLPVPQGSQIGLFPILREQLQFQIQRDPLQAPLEWIRFEVSETVPGHGSQRDFFHQKELQKEEHDLLLGRLVHRLGESSVFTHSPRITTSLKKAGTEV